MKEKIIIVEGPQGVGKTTFTNYLREKMAATDLYRLTGIKDKTETGHQKIKIKYEKLLDYMKVCEDVNLLFDRTFFTNEVYCRLGFLDYSFSETFEELLQKLDSLDFDIYLIILHLEDTDIYKKRIKRDKHLYQKFEVESSIKQQKEYLKLADEVEQKTNNIKVIRFANDDKERTNKKLEELFGDCF